MDLVGQYSDSSDDEDKMHHKTKAVAGSSSKIKTGKVKLPSLDSLLKQTKVPGYLVHAKKQVKPGKEAKEIESRKNDVSEEKDKDPSKKEDQLDVDATASEKKRKVDSGEKNSAKMTGKQRVKRQRQRGQAGIGSDFRHWKSEAEMIMRQQID